MKVIRAQGSHRLTGNLIIQSSVNMLAVVVKARTMQCSAKNSMASSVSPSVFSYYNVTTNRKYSSFLRSDCHLITVALIQRIQMDNILL